MTNTVVSVCDRAPDQEVVDEVFCRQLEEASRSQTLVFTGEFNHPNICWRSSRAGQQSRQHKQTRFGERIDDKFLTKVIKEPTMRGWLLDLTLTSMEGLVGDVKESQNPPGRDVKGNKKGFHRSIHSKRKTRKNVGPLLNGVGSWCQMTWKRLRYLTSSLPWSLLVRLAFSSPVPLRPMGKSGARKTSPGGGGSGRGDGGRFLRTGRKQMSILSSWRASGSIEETTDCFTSTAGSVNEQGIIPPQVRITLLNFMRFLFVCFSTLLRSV
ncbi:LOW QUALITY PROTEIN: hypothetical protein QYF61_009467 [Mycteria americana]|uniref:Uncharacterized protein n=1 Tax=Mycteria americana TaxID=33587 RepID=A0AAN7SDG3_MYCAM|nr:LOW QUALITY PROTEIN: hypothetical protein QYF61_009467 [Mycteria americana]